jgi:hypothetical protein
MIRKTNYTAWAATLATAAELTRQSYDVTLTFGNTPKVDLLCSASESGEQFKVQVKGVTDVKNGVFIQKHFFEDATKPDLFFVIVEVPSDDQPFRFFIMTHAQVKDAYRYWCEKHPTRKDGKEYKPGFDGLYWQAFKSYKDKWDNFKFLKKA